MRLINFYNISSYCGINIALIFKIKLFFIGQITIMENENGYKPTNLIANLISTHNFSFRFHRKRNPEIPVKVLFAAFSKLRNVDEINTFSASKSLEAESMHKIQRENSFERI